MGKHTTKYDLLVLFVIATIIISILPIPIAAQGTDHQQVLFDGEPEQIGEVHMDGQTYTVFQYENTLPYASGIQIYKDGELVTSEAEARQVIQVLAWEQATTDLDSSDIEALRGIHESAQQIDQTVTPLISILDRTLEVINELKELQVAGVSAWDAAISTSPPLQEFEPAVESMRDELVQWQQAADGIIEHVPPVIEDLERIENGEEVDHDELAQNLEASIAAIDRLQEQSTTLEERLATGSQTSATISEDVVEVPVIGGDLSEFFLEVSLSLDEAAADINEYRKVLDQQQSSLADVKATADTEEERMMEEWNTRQTAEMRVYGSIGGAGITLLGLGLLFRRRV